MAQKIQTLFIDDIDGGEAEGTVRFALDGADYEIDLSAQHTEELRSALGRYVSHARKVGGVSRRVGRAAGRATKAGNGALNTTEVRNWAGRTALTSRTAGACRRISLPSTRPRPASSQTSSGYVVVRISIPRLARYSAKTPPGIRCQGAFSRLSSSADDAQDVLTSLSVRCSSPSAARSSSSVACSPLSVTTSSPGSLEAGVPAAAG